MGKQASTVPGRYAGGAKARGIPTPMKAIRMKCLDCCCDQVQEIRECRITTCALWPYRMGRRPQEMLSD